MMNSILLLALMFQFTHPGRGATSTIVSPADAIRSFNSRTPGGVRHLRSLLTLSLRRFQFTHPGRGATRKTSLMLMLFVFQFTHPGRGATSQTMI